ncbi:MAG: hypothetical protein MPK62_03160 [Alphaproteobacteria bacterium]|nr:hypothetical protein [Alphaproteobacteria bacterium]
MSEKVTGTGTAKGTGKAPENSPETVTGKVSGTGTGKVSENSSGMGDGKSV